MAQDGAHGVSHIKLDRAAGVPDGTTSFHFRTRAALIAAVAARVAELDVADLTAVYHAKRARGAPSPLAVAVFAASREPGLTRVKARYELLMQSTRDHVLDETMRESIRGFLDLTRELVVQLRHGVDVDSAHADELNFAVMAFLNGIVMGFARNDRTITSAEHLDRLLVALVRGLDDVGSIRHRATGAPRRRRSAVKSL